jgi:D-alanyl-D-alanine carboxypeptidase
MVRRVRMRIGVLVLLSSLGATVVAYADPTDDYVNAQLDAFDLPGMSLVVAKNGTIVKAGGYGLADRERQVAPTPDTVYKIGSVSKQFIATGIMLLVQEKQIRLDDRISKYLDKTPSSWSPITIRHLLTHTAGLVRESPAFTPFKNLSDADLIRAVHPIPLRFAPGGKWEYSNTGYVALAEIIRSVTRQPWTEFLRQRIFAPAGMNVTLPTNTSAAVPTRAVGYTGRNNERKADEWVALRASGAFLSSVLDLAKWDALLNTDKILTDATKREMWARVRLSDGSSDPYGLGWHVDTGNGRRRVWHGGGLPGFTSHFVRYLDDGLTVIALSNGDDSDMGAIANGVAELHLKAAP